MTVRRGAILWASMVKAGISRRHGPHHVAHTLTRTGRPARAPVLSCGPCKPGSVTAGSRVPTTCKGPRSGAFSFGYRCCDKDDNGDHHEAAD